MNIAIGSDHGGYKLKERIVRYLADNSYQFKDMGCYTGERCDYPDFGIAVAEVVARGDFDRGILICKSGIGMSIMANKITGIRAALCLNPVMAEKSRRHNDANILVLGAEFIVPGEVIKIVSSWLNTDFESGRHQLRLAKIADYEKKQKEKK